jgi:hypothetical protein
MTPLASRVARRLRTDRFFKRHAVLIRGQVLEVGDARYSTRFGRGVIEVAIADTDPRNDDATLIVDLADSGSLPAGSFDCALVRRMPPEVSDPRAAMANLWQSLTAGGALLVTAPGLAEVLEHTCPGGTVQVEAHGDIVTGVARKAVP